nr:MAG TPA: hypothetical protein [Caudoviricetes sp.]
MLSYQHRERAAPVTAYQAPEQPPTPDQRPSAYSVPRPAHLVKR